VRGITICSFGHWTLNDRSGEAGCEPDDCFRFGKRSEVGSRPDLVIEVIWTHGGINKLEIYRRLGVKEVWFWDEGKVAVYVLEDDRYDKRTRSACLPELDLEVACRLASLESMTELIDEARKAFAP
jgi:Uma2 family endonuclease